MLAYLSYMALRLVECRSVLKETGSIYLHCDPTASHYLKVVLDAVFGAKNFRNEIVWCYSGGGIPKNDFPRKHDVIFRYSKTDTYLFNKDAVRVPYDSDYKATVFSGKATRAPGKIYKPNPRGKIVEDWWRNLPRPYGKESLGYPTQKPLALLERIIRASSNPGDIVLDPFCGCGTTVEAAATLNRQFIGIDIASFALDLIRERRLQNREVPIIGVPLQLEDAAQMVKEDAFAFEKWAIERIPGLLANQVQVGDGGIDGRGRTAYPLEGTEANLVLAQVKGGEFKPNDLRAFRGVMASEEAALGIFITLRKLEGRQRRNAERELAGFGMFQQGASEFPRLQLWSIEEYYDDRFPYMPTLAHPITGKALEGPLL